MSENDDLNIEGIGDGLVAFSREAETSVRGLVTELFPYIYQASKRMSTRAISKYLLETHHVKLSAASIAKALREPGKHAEAFAEKLEPIARVVSEAWKLTLRDVLTNRDNFEHFTRKNPDINPEDDDPHNSVADQIHECEGARDSIRWMWYDQDARFRGMVLPFIQLEDENEIKEGKL